MPGTIGHPDAAAADAISARLASIQGLRLPASLLREQPYPEGTAVKAHLTDLLQRDASVFLEVRGGAAMRAPLGTSTPTHASSTKH
jgi:hypothetical protein